MTATETKQFSDRIIMKYKKTLPKVKKKLHWWALYVKPIYEVEMKGLIHSIKGPSPP